MLISLVDGGGALIVDWNFQGKEIVRLCELASSLHSEEGGSQSRLSLVQGSLKLVAKSG